MNRLIFCILLFISSAYSQSSESLKTVKLGWDEVDESKAYELELYKDDALFKQETTTELEWEGKLSAGSYKYRLRAIDVFDRPGEWTAFEDFTVRVKVEDNENAQRKNIAHSQRSTIGANISWNQYDYNSRIGNVGFGKLSGAAALGVGADLQYWFWNRFGLDLKGAYYSSNVEGTSVNYPELSAGLKYSLLIDSNFFVNPLATFEYQNTPEYSFASSQISTFRENLISSLGIGMGIEMGTAFSDAWILQVHGRYIWPIKIDGDRVTSSSPDSALFYKFGVNLQYYWTQHWLIGVELGGDYRELSYQSFNKNDIEKKGYYLMLLTRYVFDSPSKK